MLWMNETQPSWAEDAERGAITIPESGPGATIENARPDPMFASEQRLARRQTEYE